jgi:iron(III) transport system substrate-binding protein
MRMRTTKSWLVLPLCLATLVACGDDKDAVDRSLPDDIDAACSKAEDEGTLSMWGGSDEEVARPIFDEFAKTHPGIKYEYLAVRPDEAAPRIITESAAGEPPSIDLVSFEAYTVVGLLERGLIDEEIDWTTLGVPESRVTAQNAVTWSSNAQGITYNTDLVTADELPESWDDLLDPKWRGQVVVDPRGRPFDKLSLIWGEEKTLEYVQKLKENQPIIIEGGTAGMVAVGSGEAAITAGGLTIETQEQQAASAPVAFQYLDAITTEDAILNVLSEAQHPNAAYCFAAWMGSDEGQDVIEEISFGRAELEDLPPAADAVGIETVEEADQVSGMSETIAEIWAEQ